jgi:hypothetical protein
MLTPCDSVVHTCDSVAHTTLRHMMVGGGGWACNRQCSKHKGAVKCSSLWVPKREGNFDKSSHTRAAASLKLPKRCDQPFLNVHCS